MAGTLDAPEPGTTAAVAVPPAAPAPATVQPSVQDAIDSAVEAFRAQLEGKIKTSLGITPATPATTAAPGIVSRALGDVKTGIGDVGSGTKEVAGDFLDVVRGRQASIKDGTGAEHNIPRVIVYIGVAFAFVGVATVVDLALHALHWL